MQEQKRNEKLSTEVNTLRLARKDMQRRFARLQQELAIAWRGRALPEGNAQAPGAILAQGNASNEEGNVSSLDPEANSECVVDTNADSNRPFEMMPTHLNDHLSRAERVAEKERTRARGLEKDLQHIRQELEDTLTQLHQAESSRRSGSEEMRSEYDEAGADTNLRDREETILKLRREVGQMSKSRSDLRKRFAYLEQQFLEEKKRNDNLEGKMLELQAGFQHSRPSSAREFQSPPRSARSSTARSPSSSGKQGRAVVSSAEKNSELRALREENARLLEELRRSRSDTCKARAEVAPLREENLRLSAEIRAILQSRLTSSEEAMERRPPWGASEKFGRSLSSWSGARAEKLSDASPLKVAGNDGRYRRGNHHSSSPPMSRSLSPSASSPAIVQTFKSPNSRDGDRIDDVLHQEDRNAALEHSSGLHMEPLEFTEELNMLGSEPLRAPDLRGSRSG